MLGALLSVMFEWPIGHAMPTVNGQQLQMSTTNNSCTSGSNISNCSATSYNVTNSGRVINRNTSDKRQNSNSSNSSSDSSQQQMVTMSSVEDPSVSTMRSMQQDRLNRIYNKRKRKKTVTRVTADMLRNIRTHSFDSVEHQQQHDSKLNSESIFTTVSSIIDDNNNSTFLQYLSRTDRSVHNVQNKRKLNSNLDRNERSANLSHISGPARKIQLYIKNRFIQLLPDGTVNGTQDDVSDYTILQRTTVDVGQIKIQGVATCLYLCMDQCGAVYGSKSFSDDCVFNESMEQHHYNTYSSTYNSNSRRTLYLALNRHGIPRKLQIPPTRTLGKLATYTKALTETVPQERIEKLIARTFGANRVKHGLRQLCDAGKPLIELTTKVMKSRPKCNINANGQAVMERIRISNNSHNSTSSSGSSISNSGSIRKKKKKRRCRPNENENEHNCHRPGPQALKKRPQKQKCTTPEECAANRKKHNNNNKKQKGHGPNQGGHKKRKGPNNRKSRLTDQSNIKPMGKAKQISTTPSTTASTTTSTASTPITTTFRSTTTSSEQQSSTEDDTDGGEQDSPHSGSVETGHDDDENNTNEDSSSISSLGGHTQLIGDDFFYDEDFDV